MFRFFEKIPFAPIRRSFVKERRAHARATSYWHSLEGDHEFPLDRDFDFQGDDDFCSQGFMLNVESDQPTFIHLGEILLEEAQIDCPATSLSDVPPSSLLGQFGRRYPQVLAERKPVVSEYMFVTDANFRVSCRCALLPLSTNGDDLDRVFGVISWKSEKVADHG